MFLSLSRCGGRKFINIDILFNTIQHNFYVSWSSTSPNDVNSHVRAETANKLEAEGKTKSANRYRISSYVAGAVGVLATIGIVAWLASANSCKLSQQTSGDNCQCSKNAFGSCTVSACCLPNSILYRNACYRNSTGLSPTICVNSGDRGALCYTNRYYYGYCTAANRCCALDETYFGSYCYYNVTSTRSCRYSVNGLCYDVRYCC